MPVACGAFPARGLAIAGGRRPSPAEGIAGAAPDVCVSCGRGGRSRRVPPLVLWINEDTAAIVPAQAWTLGAFVLMALGAGIGLLAA